MHPLSLSLYFVSLFYLLLSPCLYMFFVCVSLSVFLSLFLFPSVSLNLWCVVCLCLCTGTSEPVYVCLSSNYLFEIKNRFALFQRHYDQYTAELLIFLFPFLPPYRLSHPASHWPLSRYSGCRRLFNSGSGLHVHGTVFLHAPQSSRVPDLLSRAFASFSMTCAFWSSSDGDSEHFSKVYLKLSSKRFIIAAGRQQIMTNV